MILNQQLPRCLSISRLAKHSPSEHEGHNAPFQHCDGRGTKTRRRTEPVLCGEVRRCPAVVCDASAKLVAIFKWPGQVGVIVIYIACPIEPPKSRKHTHRIAWDAKWDLCTGLVVRSGLLFPNSLVGHSGIGEVVGLLWLSAASPPLAAEFLVLAPAADAAFVPALLALVAEVVELLGLAVAA